MSIAKAITAVLVLLIPLLTLRILAILPSRRPKPRPRKRGTQTHLLIVLGSGGHTAEMVAMLRNAVKGREGEKQQQQQQQQGEKEGEKKRNQNQSETNPQKLLEWRNYTHRTWIVGSGDDFSASRAQELEAEFAEFYNRGTSSSTPPSSTTTSSPSSAAAAAAMGTHSILTIPRARRIHQPLYSTPLTSLQTLYATVLILIDSPHDLPDLILVNGPATAAIVVAATVVMRFFDIRGAQARGKCRTVYVESWARVRKLSLSARLLCWAGGVERVLVQWAGLEGAGGGRGEYLGVLV